MDIVIKETQEEKELNIFDPEYGQNWTEDLIGNTGAFEDGLFIPNEDEDVYYTSQANFDWWEDIIKQKQETDNRIYRLKQEYGHDKVIKAIEDAALTDLEDESKAINKALNEYFGEDVNK